MSYLMEIQFEQWQVKLSQEVFVKENCTEPYLRYETYGSVEGIYLNAQNVILSVIIQKVDYTSLSPQLVQNEQAHVASNPGSSCRELDSILGKTRNITNCFLSMHRINFHWTPVSMVPEIREFAQAPAQQGLPPAISVVPLPSHSWFGAVLPQGSPQRLVRKLP